MSSEPIDIGHGVSIEFVRNQAGDREVGLFEYHTAPNGRPCEGVVFWDESYHEHHDLVQREPLTVSPSLLCAICGHHGFIREGRWVPA